MKTRWYYSGAVSCPDGTYSEIWGCETLAETKEKAKTNIKYQYRKSHGKPINMPVRLYGEIALTKSSMKYETTVEGPLRLKKEDFTQSEWDFLCKIFGINYTEYIHLDKYIIGTYGARKEKANGS